MLLRYKLLLLLLLSNAILNALQQEFSYYFIDIISLSEGNKTGYLKRSIRNYFAYKNPKANRLPYVLSGFIKKYQQSLQLKDHIEKVTLVEDVEPLAFLFGVRVWLDECDCTKTVGWKLSSTNGFLISDPQIPSRRGIIQEKELLIEIKDGHLLVNGTEILKKTIKIEPAVGELQYAGNRYDGSLLIVNHEEKFFLLSHLDIEDYIYSVLRWESWPGWPVEINKAFAIASRSYLVSKILQANRVNRPYHIKNSNVHQTYNGTHENQILWQAVDETRGIILTYNRKPIDAMFDICCGGVIPAHISSVDFSRAPYLARTSRCTYCKDSKVFNWKIEYSVEQVEKLMKEKGIFDEKIRDIKIVKKDKAGVVISVALRGSKTEKYITGKECYSLFVKIKSHVFTVQKRGTKIIFEGKGYGHHLGICQWGARSMIDEGWNFSTILGFYYPGTKFMKLRTQNREIGEIDARV